jgi:hypothetical protein
VADTALILGLAGIGGTLLASVTANYTTLQIERHRRRREDAAAQAQLREALRLVQGDVERVRSLFEGALERGEMWPPSESLTAGHLDGYRELLARELDDPLAWGAVRQVEMIVDKVVTVIVEFGARGNFEMQPPVAGPLIDLLRLGVEACNKASDGLLLAEAGVGLGPRRRRLLHARARRRGHGRDTDGAAATETPE